MKFYIYTLGCKVNTYESNVMSDLLINAGFIKTNDIADIYIINTCSVTNTADNKSLKLIRQAIRKNNKAIIVVTGCLSQTQVERILPIAGVSIILGNKNKSKIVDYINDYLKDKKRIVDIYDLSKADFECMQLNNFDQTRAFVKIEDGCENFCSYCIIPYTRGRVRSKLKEDVIKEVSALIKSGHREIVLTGIHTGNYGYDLDYDFASLLKDLIKIEGLERLRISSIEITELKDNVLEVIKNSNVLVDHLHIPLQSGSDYILKKMNRKYDVDYFVDKINKIRKIRPNISITTDVIVGFPNETDEMFNETIMTIKKIKFSKLHVFPYSRRKGTEADLMSNQVNEEVKKQRVQELLKLSKKLEINYMNKFIDQEITFIPEVKKDGYLIGHTGNYLLIKLKDNNYKLHENLLIKIVNVEYPYCIGQIVDTNN